MIIIACIQSWHISLDWFGELAELKYPVIASIMANNGGWWELQFSGIWKDTSVTIKNYVLYYFIIVHYTNVPKFGNNTC